MTGAECQRREVGDEERVKVCVRGGDHVGSSFVSQGKDKILEYWDDTLKC